MHYRVEALPCVPRGVTITVCAIHEAICGTLSEKFAATLKLEPPLQERGRLQALESQLSWWQMGMTKGKNRDVLLVKDAVETLFWTGQQSSTLSCRHVSYP